MSSFYGIRKMCKRCGEVVVVNNPNRRSSCSCYESKKKEKNFESEICEPRGSSILGNGPPTDCNPENPFEGMLYIEQDTRDIYIYWGGFWFNIGSSDRTSK
jgi:hypothetical protein